MFWYFRGMTTSAESLAAKLQRFTGPQDLPMLIANINDLEEAAPSFTSTAARLIDTNDSSFEMSLTMWLHNRAYRAIDKAESVSSESGMNYDAARLIFEDSVIHSSVQRMSDEMKGYLQESREAHYTLLPYHCSPRINMLEASAAEVDCYCHPLTIAASFINPRKHRDHFTSSAPAFIKWVSEQDDLNAAIQAATRLGSIDVSALESFMKVVGETHSSINSGVL